MAATRAAQNKKIRQEALREQLSSQKHVEHVIELLGKIQKPVPFETEDMLARYKLVIDTKLKLINKYLPDLKSQEIDLNHGVQDSLDSLIEQIDGTSSGLDE